LRSIPFAAVLATAATLLGGGAARAETIRVACAANIGFNAPEMALVYEGGESGSLTVTGGFGTMQLPASKQVREGADDDGQPLTAINIHASGPANILMPDKAALEACVSEKLVPEYANDIDVIYATIMGCAQDVPPSAAPVAINASVDITLTPEVFLGYTRTYDGPTNLPGGEIKLDAFPNCSREP